MAELPDDVGAEAERLSRLARDAHDVSEAAAYREERDRLLAEHDFAAHVREEDDGSVLVCYPTDWIEDGVVRPARVEDRDRAVERRLSGSGSGEDWDEVAAHNDALVERVAAGGDADHTANARALADFASNHYAKRIEDLTLGEIEEFLTEYFPRNAWPTECQRSLVDESVRRVFEETETACPLVEGAD